MAQRLLVIAHGRAGSAGDPVFGDRSPLAAGVTVAPVEGRFQRWVCGPETACGETALLLARGEEADVIPELAGPDLGRWTGSTLSTIAGQDPDGLRSWLTDPDAAPHGGESLSRTAVRVGTAIDDTDWPEGRTAVVVSPAVARLLALHAIGGTPALAFRLDVRFGGRFELSAAGRGWRLLLG